MANSKTLKITLVKSLIGRLPKHLRTAESLGLRKMHQTIMCQDTPAVRGKINQLHYLLKVEECD